MARRVVFALIVGLVAWGSPLAVSASTATPLPSMATKEQLSLSDPAKLADFENAHAGEIKAFNADLAVARPYLSLDTAGYMVVAPGYHPRKGGVDVAARVTALNALRKADLGKAKQVRQATPGVTDAAAYGCFTIPSWALWWAGLLYEQLGGLTIGLSLFADGTLIGLPLGAVMAAGGLLWVVYGGYLQYGADHWWPNGLTICTWQIYYVAPGMGYFWDGLQQVWLWF
jgi:hypothetical protein